MRFRELQAEKELRQLQEDRKNDRKPPPYKHIKVREKTFVSVLVTKCSFKDFPSNFTAVNSHKSLK